MQRASWSQQSACTRIGHSPSISNETMIEEILPSEVSVAEAFTDVTDAYLFPEECGLITGVVDSRRRELATGRACAREALARLSVPPGPILRGDRGAPLWPPGIVGAITHCAGYCAAAVARRERVLAVGIDAEPNRPLPAGVLDTIATAAERSGLAALRLARPQVNWELLVFSAKESVYKAWFPVTARWLGFEDVEVSIEPDAGTFAARLLVPAPEFNSGQLTVFTGRWLIRGGVFLTAVSVPAR